MTSILTERYDKRCFTVLTGLGIFTVLVAAFLILQDIPFNLIFNTVRIQPTLLQKNNVRVTLKFDSVYGNCNKTYSKSNFITILKPTGRLGNNLFQFLSLIGIAIDHCFKPVISQEFADHLKNVFDLSFIEIMSKTPKNWRRYRVGGNGTIYSSGVKDLDHRNNWTLTGYFQSWRYFDRHKHFIKSKLRFREDISNQVDVFFQNTKELVNKTKVGVHVRRGDFLLKRYQKIGYSTASVGFLKRSLNYFTKKFKNQSLVFIVLSDDIRWCKENMKQPNVYFSPFSSSKLLNSAGLDLALMSKCDHSILTSGTFGWLGAWLAEGDVVYFKGFPTPGSLKDKRLNRTDYYPPYWKGLI